MTPLRPHAGPSWPAAAALYAAGWAALAWPWLSGTVTIPWDAKAHFYPQLQFLAQSLHRGESPFWTPFAFSGSPQVADPQSLIFSPPFLALAWLHPDPGFQAFDAVVLGALGIGGLFILLLFRDRNWHPAGALVAALALAFGASAAWRIQHVGQILSLAAWPVALWLLRRALERRSLAYGVLAGAAAGILALGRDQVAYLALWLLAAAALDHCCARPVLRRLKDSLWPLAAAAAAGVVVVAVPIALTALLAESSNRPAVDVLAAEQGSLHPALLLTAAIPNLFGVDGPFADYWGPPSPRWGPVDLFLARNMGALYIGALPLALIIAGTRGFLWAREVRVFSLGLVVMLLYALGRYTPAFAALFEIMPGADFFRRPADATFLIGALAAILAGCGVHRLWSGTLQGQASVLVVLSAAVMLAVLCTGVWLAAAKGTLALAAWPLTKAALFLGAALALIALLPKLIERSRPFALAVLLAFVLTDLASNNGPNESTALPPSQFDALLKDSRNETLAAIKARLLPGSLDRVELVGLGFHWPNVSLVHGLHNTLGYNPVRLGLYTAATGAGDHVALPDQRRFAPLFPSYRSTLADLLGLRLIATGVPVERIDPALKPGDLTLVAQTPDGFVYENPRSRLRAFFVGEAREVDADALLREGAWPDVDLSKVVLLSQPPAAAPPTSGDPAAATVTITAYRNTQVVVDVEAPAAGYLVLNDPYQPWWRAKLDGRETPILRANGIFRAVAVPAGRHRVRFDFDPLTGAWREAERRWPLLARLTAVGVP